LSTAIKRGLLEKSARDKVIEQMATLNKSAADIMLGFNVSACTDITGFGLMGHLFEMSSASKCDVDIIYNHVPFIEEVEALASAGSIPGGTFNNLEYVSPHVDFGSIGRTRQLMLCDAQTSGGLLIALSPEEAKKCLDLLKSSGVFQSEIIGEFKKPGNGQITIK
jgi:selenide,water dikinase